MMAEGRFASLPRSLHTHHSLGSGGTHPGVPSSALCPPGGGTCSSRRLQASLVTSMDLLGTRPGWVDQQSNLMMSLMIHEPFVLWL